MEKADVRAELCVTQLDEAVDVVRDAVPVTIQLGRAAPFIPRLLGALPRIKDF